MASLIRPWIVIYIDSAGKRVPKGTPGAKKSRERAGKWYGQGIPGLPPRKRVPLAADKVAAQRMLEDIVRKAERGQTSLPDRDAGRVPLAEYLTSFEKDMTLGLASRKKARRVPDASQVSLCVQRIRAVLDGCTLADPADLNDDAPRRVAAYLQQRTRLPRKDGGLSHQTAAFMLAAVRRFVWWLSARKRVPVRPDLLDDVPGFDPSGNRVHSRRPITAEELARLLEAALKSTRPVRGLAGPARYHLYLTAFATGFRAAELAALTPANFLLDSDPPAVALSGKKTKNRKAARCPLPVGVANQLRTFLAGKPAASPVWPGPWHEHAAEVLRLDLEAAGVPYALEGPHGTAYADFHALRHSFVTALAAAGVGQKELQELARHADPRLTLGLYTHTSPEQLAGAVGRLAIPGATDPNPLAKISRTDLEGLTVGLMAALDAILAPQLASEFAPALAPLLAPAGGISGDAGKLPDTKPSVGKRSRK